MDRKTMKKPKLVVIFRVFNKHPREVFALFPQLSGNRVKGNCEGYDHFGQHFHADYDEMIRMSRPAKPAEYGDLLRELKSIGYGKNEVLAVQKRYCKQNSRNNLWV